VTALSCYKCKQIKASSEFTNAQQRKGGGRRCRPCIADYNREYQKTRPPRRRVDMTPEQVELRRQHDRGRDPAVVADRWFRYRYGLTVAEVDAMIEEQGGVCAICCQPETRVDPRTKKIRRLSVDHDHRTGLPRRMLCQRCNWVLSRVDDDIPMLERFVSYLEQHAAGTFPS
jgi:hypothetical protein